MEKRKGRNACPTTPRHHQSARRGIRPLAALALALTATAASIGSAETATTSPVASFLWEGRPWRLIDDAGVFAIPLDDEGAGSSADADAITTAPLPAPNRDLATVLSRRAPEPPVPLRLVDYVDATTTAPRGFLDDGRSRVLDLPSGRFRVTGAPRGFELHWFSFTIRTSGQAGRPHLLVFELSNDRERYTTVNLDTPPQAPWAPPYEGAHSVAVDAITLTQEPIWYGPDVGLSVYTGRELPVDNRPIRAQFLFYPKTSEMLLTVSSSGWARQVDDLTGGALSRVWVYEVAEPLRDHLPPIDPPTSGTQRRLGVYATHPWYFLGHYGAPPHTLEQRRQSLENLCDTLAFSGMNLIQFNAVNGSDRAGRAWYPNSYYSPRASGLPDLLSELPPVAAGRGIAVVPVVTSITAPGSIPAEGENSYGFSQMSFQHPADPKSDPRAFENRPPDPMRPETQDWLIRHLVEVAERSSIHDNVLGVGFRVNGKIGTCYISGEDKSGADLRIVPASEAGYSPWNLAEFRRETGLQVPDDSWEAYVWLRADARRWDRWLDFRCRRTHAFWLRARDAVRAVRPDWLLYVLTDLPSEVQATNEVWPGMDHPDARTVTLDLLRAHGYDPRMFANETGIVVQRVMMIDMERFFSKWGPPFGSNPERYRDFHEQPFLPDWYATAAGSGVELYHTYWEEPFHPRGEFGPNAMGFGLRTATAMAWGGAFYRPFAFAAATGDCDTIVLNGWTRPTLGQEHLLRRFARAWRALPTGPRQALTVDLPATGVVAARYDDRVVAVNRTDQPTQAKIRLFAPAPRNRALLDAATGAVIINRRASERAILDIHLDGYETRTFIMEKD